MHRLGIILKVVAIFNVSFYEQGLTRKLKGSLINEIRARGRYTIFSLIKNTPPKTTIMMTLLWLRASVSVMVLSLSPSCARSQHPLKGFCTTKLRNRISKDASDILSVPTKRGNDRLLEAPTTKLMQEQPKRKYFSSKYHAGFSPPTTSNLPPIFWWMRSFPFTLKLKLRHIVCKSFFVLNSSFHPFPDISSFNLPPSIQNSRSQS